MVGSTEARDADRRTKCARRVSEANPFRRARNIAEPIEWYAGTTKWATRQIYTVQGVSVEAGGDQPFPPCLGTGRTGGDLTT